jgi:hypothetical protein
MTRYQPKYPPGEHRISVECPARKCDHEWKLPMTVEEDGSLEPFETRCPKCDRRLVITSDWKIYVRWRRLAGNIAGYCLIPFALIDIAIWYCINSVSVFVQKTFHLSKYLLALGAYVLGLGAMYTFQTIARDGKIAAALSITLLWTVINLDFLIWCWRKIREGDQEEGDVLVRHDAVMRNRSRSSRFTILLLVFLCLPLEIASPDGFILSIFILNLGHYFVDSAFVPPSKRLILEMGSRWLGNEI